VSEPPYYLHSHQCKRKPWKDGLCKQHHPDTRAERNRKRREIADEKRKNSAWFQLGEARRRIADLERELAEARDERRMEGAWKAHELVHVERKRCINAVEVEPEPNHPTPIVAAIIRAVKANIIERIKREVQGE